MMVDPATTHVATSETADGVAIAFTTTDDVNALRDRVRAMAERHNRMQTMHSTGGMHGGPPETRMRMVPSRATVDDIPGGARLVLVPIDPSQLATLRHQAEMHAGMMQRGQCPRMARAGVQDAKEPE